MIKLNPLIIAKVFEFWTLSWPYVFQCILYKKAGKKQRIAKWKIINKIMTLNI